MYEGGFLSDHQRVYSWMPRSSFQALEKVWLVHRAGSCTTLTSGASSVPGCPSCTPECVSGSAPESPVFVTHTPTHLRTQAISYYTFKHTLAHQSCSDASDLRQYLSLSVFPVKLKCTHIYCMSNLTHVHFCSHRSSSHTGMWTYVTPNSSEIQCN